MANLKGHPKSTHAILSPSSLASLKSMPVSPPLAVPFFAKIPIYQIKVFRPTSRTLYRLSFSILFLPNTYLITIHSKNAHTHSVHTLVLGSYASSSSLYPNIIFTPRLFPGSSRANATLISDAVSRRISVDSPTMEHPRKTVSA